MIWRIKWFEPLPNTLQLHFSEWDILNSTTPTHPKDPKQPTSLSSKAKSFFHCQNYDLWDCCNLHCAYEWHVVVYEYWFGIWRCIWWFGSTVHSSLLLLSIFQFQLVISLAVLRNLKNLIPKYKSHH